MIVSQIVLWLGFLSQSYCTVIAQTTSIDGDQTRDTDPESSYPEQPHVTTASKSTTTNSLNLNLFSQTSSGPEDTTDSFLINADNVTVPTTEIQGREDSPLRVVCPVDSNSTNVTWHKQSGDSYTSFAAKSKSSNDFLLEKLTHGHSGVYRCSRSSQNNTDTSDDSGEVIAFIKLTVISAPKSPSLISRKGKSTDSISDSDATNLAYTSTLPKYSGLYIGLGVCMCLFLLSGGAVCILNLTNNGTLTACCSFHCLSLRKDDKSTNGLSRLAAHRGSVRNGGANMKMLPIQRMARSNSDANA